MRECALRTELEPPHGGPSCVIPYPYLTSSGSLSLSLSLYFHLFCYLLRFGASGLGSPEGGSPRFVPISSFSSGFVPICDTVPCFLECSDLFQFAPISSDFFSEQQSEQIKEFLLLPTPFANPLLRCPSLDKSCFHCGRALVFHLSAPESRAMNSQVRNTPNLASSNSDCEEAFSE